MLCIRVALYRDVLYKFENERNIGDGSGNPTETNQI